MEGCYVIPENTVTYIPLRNYLGISEVIHNICHGCSSLQHVHLPLSRGELRTTVL